ncbi:MAG: oligosaccharide flippase family protein [Bacteroidales bacterium]|nr:oligosaccharide flippase family protein [Bacteroidales bacterium]
MPQTNNTKQAAWVAVGSLCSFGFTIVSSMILSRYFNKADYGTYKQVMYVYNTLLTVFTLGLPKAFSYFLPRVELAQSKSLISKITNLFFILGGVFSLLLFVFAPQIAAFLKNPDLVKALKIFAIVPFLMLPTMGMEGILATFKQTKFIALYNILTNVFKLLCVALPVMIWDLSYIEALWGFVGASFITFLLALYLKYLPVRNQPKEKCPVSIKDIFRFSIPLLTASLWGIIISSCDQFFVSRYFGNETFAEFSNGWLPLPFVGMIMGATATVLSPIFSRMSHEKVDPLKEIYPLWMSVFEKSAKLIYPLVIYCLVFADVVMTVMYGQQYTVSGSYFRIKLITEFFATIIFAPLIINIGEVKFYSRVHMVVAITVVVLEFISVRTIQSPYAVSWVSTLCQVGKTFAFLWLVAKFFGIKIYQLFPIKLIVQILIPSVALLLLERWVLVDQCRLNFWVVLIISFVVYVALFYVYSLVVKMDYFGIIKPLIKNNTK